MVALLGRHSKDGTWGWSCSCSQVLGNWGRAGPAHTCRPFWPESGLRKWVPRLRGWGGTLWEGDVFQLRGSSGSFWAGVTLFWPSEWLFWHLYVSLKVSFCFLDCLVRGCCCYWDICPFAWSTTRKFQCYLIEWAKPEAAWINDTCRRARSLVAFSVRAWTGDKIQLISQAGYSFCLPRSDGGRGSRKCLMKCL